MFAKSRIDKLIGLKTNEISSIGTISNPEIKQVPAGKKREKSFTPCF